MYSRLYDSMIAWYRQWFALDSQLNRAASLALGVMIYLNLISLANIIDLLGFWDSFAILGADKFVTSSVFAALLLFHLAYGAWKQGRSVRLGHVFASKRAAVMYMLATVLVLITSTASVIATRE